MLLKRPFFETLFTIASDPTIYCRREKVRMSNNHWQRDKRPGVDDLVLLNNVCFPSGLNIVTIFYEPLTPPTPPKKKRRSLHANEVPLPAKRVVE